MPLRSLFLLFLRLGATSFGGYMVLVAQIQDEVVEKRKLITPEEFLKGLSLCQLLPGALSVNVSSYVGHRLAGTMGAVAAIIAVLLPATVLTLVLAILYFRFHHLPATEGFFQGIGPVVAVLIGIAGWRLAGRMGRGTIPVILAAATFAYVAFFGGNILVPLIASGLAGLATGEKN
ncbi:MAG: chromate transporter [Nitrospirota bacterium]|nr:chromate transporter [Nitrospirota bacterium]